MKTAYITHPDCLKHDMGHNHPECPARLKAIEDQLKSTGLMAKLHTFSAPKATKAVLARAHPEEFIDEVLATVPTEGLQQIDGDTIMNPYSGEAALRAAGAGILAVDLVMSGNVNRAFCNVRPPGHHAEKDRAMGFCFFNNIAVAARHSIEHHKLKRVAIVDFDVHHGNGTENIFARDEQVLFCSTYQHPFYPGYAGQSVKAQIVNIPLSSGATGTDFRAAVTQKWLPELIEFKPELILISAGFDAHAEDNMGGINLVDEDYRWVTEALCKLSNDYSQSRIVSMLEGGYDLPSLGRAAAEHVGVMLEN